MPLVSKKKSKIPIIVKTIEDMKDPKKGLDPVIGDDCIILILGTFPGEVSLEYSQYYYDKTNRFWPTMSTIFDLHGTYNIKTKTLVGYGVGIWDIFSFAQRVGSSDNKIEKAMYNDILNLSNKYKKLKTLVFNGKNAYEWLRENYQNIFDNHECIRLQSTSGLNGNFNKGKDWKEFFNNKIFA